MAYEEGPGVLAACAARRWLARNAAGVKLVRTHTGIDPVAWTSLVSCLPALQDVTLHLTGLADILLRNDVGCLLEALAWCHHLKALDLSMVEIEIAAGEIDTWPFPDAAAFAKLRSLTRLALSFREDGQVFLADIVSALAPLTGLAELSLKLLMSPIVFDCPDQPAVVPAALGHLKGLRSLRFTGFSSFHLEAGCLNLPNLLSLEIEKCYFKEGAQMLPGVSALECVTRIAFMHIEVSGTKGSCVLDPQLVRLPHLQSLVLSHMHVTCDNSSTLHSVGLPAGMGLLSSSLLQLNVSGLLSSHFPLALTQFVALECLDASYNSFAELPFGITALSKLTTLRLGRGPVVPLRAPPLDVRALGDLSDFPALRNLDFQSCQVMLCLSLLGAKRHASLATLCFSTAYPAPECMLIVLLLSRELRRLGRGGVVRCGRGHIHCDLLGLEGRAACQKFEADLDACGL